ncbi:uncharacterized protein PRCAT00004159001 [Priceomyces carsonii]|uniref:uncharacterized protein n=1 Tax=Priceomyces carsonii TaxID=28549 RepID=UPI002EDB2957|nr:unnamed protein product [Priceomyces carsonii]
MAMEQFRMYVGLLPRINVIRASKRQIHCSSALFAGHSKWANIRHDKAKNDAKKSKEAYTIATRIVSSVKTGGVEGNAQLETLIEKAKKLNVTKKIIENAIKRGTGEISNDGLKLQEVMYEFMGPGGVAFIVTADTDNRNRTIGTVKHALSQFNAALSPCLYLFQKKGVILVEPLKELQSLDEILEDAIEVGAEDVDEYEDVGQEYNADKLFRMITDVAEVNKVSNNLNAKGYKLRESITLFIADPENEVAFPDGQEKGLKKCLEMLDEIPEVSNYYSNLKD